MQLSSSMRIFVNPPVGNPESKAAKHLLPTTLILVTMAMAIPGQYVFACSASEGTDITVISSDQVAASGYKYYMVFNYIVAPFPSGTKNSGCSQCFDIPNVGNVRFCDYLVISVGLTQTIYYNRLEYCPSGT
jgi:hypothetical protein